jgi:hypothetical protein
MIDAVRQDLIQHGAEAVADPAVNQFALTLSTFLSSFTAYSDLEQAIRIRVADLGLPSRDLTPNEIGSLDAQRASIEAALALGVPSESVRGAIGSFLSNVQGLLEQTNNLPALKDSLDFGFSALVRDQQLDAGTQGLSDFINRLESSGQIAPDVAGQLRNQVAAAQAEITAGHFYEAQSALNSLASWIRLTDGQQVPPSVASNLLAYTATLRSATPSFNQGGPALQDVQRLGFHRQPTQTTLTFNEPLNPSSAVTLSNYEIIATSPDGRFGTRDDRAIRIKSARYDATTNTVTLNPARRLDLHRRYELIVNGSMPTGITDMAGNLLDGAANGKPGSNYVVVLRGFGPDEPGRPFRKLIRDQHGGKPMSSRRVNLRASSRVVHQTHAGPAHSTPQHSLRDERASVPHGPLSSRRMRRGR